MLSEDVINKLSDRVASRMTEANTYVLKKIGESIGKIKDLTPSQAQQLGQILKYGGSYEEIAQKIAELSKMNIQDVYEIFKQVAKKDYSFAKQFYDYKGVDYIPFEENLALQRQVQSLASLTANTFANICNTRNIGFGMQDELGNLVFRGLQETYYNTIDQAVLSVSQGKETFENQMYKTIKELGGGGLKTISDKTYETTVKLPDGTEKTVIKHYTRRLDSAIRMNMQDALRNLHNEVQKQVGEEFGSDGVEISVHSRPAPDHAEVQGHQFSNEEFEKFQTDQDAVDYEGVIFPAEFDGRDRRSISEYNCYHYIFSIVLGVSEPLYTQKQLQQIIDDNEKGFELDGKHYTLYEGIQLQRQLETEIRKAKDIQIMANASGNEEAMGKAQQRITMLKNKYNELSQVSGIPTQLERSRVSGYTTKGRKYPRKIEYKNADQNLINKMQLNSDKMFSKLSEKEYKYIRAYTLSDYKPINKALKIQKEQGIKIKDQEIIDDPLVPNVIEKIKEMDKRMMPIEEDLILYRGTAYKHYKDYNIGDVIDSGMYTSTSLLEETTDDFINRKLYRDEYPPMLMEIHAPKGTKGIYYGSNTALSLDEKELLLDRNYKYKVISIEDKKWMNKHDIKKMVVEVVK